ncbi:HAD family hydrolase [Paeniglutamicibacter cryotolerans]|uniref:HAD family phosphatase n=1 Tax=Paeniglutamicibacter cryotolerans TaxID=670079 RepID=A0A839QFC2_9MICC|nr:HAD family hydrolase [Paeniglutamicibacter cryotolerans]MBB2994978.1 hypothetical protein [Paeniglutamicibacter cryotolerans]
MIASDLDGTIIRPDGTISPRTVAAFEAARASGIHIVFVTGRPFRWLAPVSAAFGHLGTVICSNGAVVYDLEAERLIEAKTLPAASLREVRDIVLEFEPGARFAAETTRGVHLERGFLDPAERSIVKEPEQGMPDVGVLASEGVVKFLAKSWRTTPDAFMEEVAPHISHLVSVTHSAPSIALLEMARRDVNKSVALAGYAAELGIGAAEIMAFGDMPNDVEMLGWVGHGYAMASGHRLAKEAARHLAGPLEDDGVALAIEQMLCL